MNFGPIVNLFQGTKKFLRRLLKAIRAMLTPLMIKIIILGVLLFFIFPFIGLSREVIYTFWGIPVEVSMLAVLVVITIWAHGRHYYRNAEARLSHYQSGVVAFIVIIAWVVPMTMHEFAHVIVASAFGNPLQSVIISFWGVGVMLTNLISSMSPLQQILTILSGPAIHAIFASLAFVLVKNSAEGWTKKNIMYVAVVNLELFLFNMLPILPTDGSLALNAFLRFLFIDEKVRSFFFVFIFTCICLACLRYGKNYLSFIKRMAKK